MNFIPLACIFIFLLIIYALILMAGRQEGYW